jgi:protein-disulfide isomerase
VEVSLRDRARRDTRFNRANALYIIGGVVLFAVIIAVFLILYNRPSGGEPLAEGASHINPNIPRGVTPEGIPFLGNPIAPVTITLYEDMGCPSCKAFWETTEPTLIDAYVVTGRVRLDVYTLAIVNAQSLPAAEALACASDQGKFWTYRDILFANQGARAFSRENLVAFASSIDLDVEEFKDCFDFAIHKEDVQEQSQRAAEFGIQVTPTLDINGRQIQGVLPFVSQDPETDGMKDILDQALENS